MISRPASLTAPRIVRSWNQRWSAFRSPGMADPVTAALPLVALVLAGLPLLAPGQVLPRLLGLGVDDLELGDVLVPLEERRAAAALRHGGGVDVPDRVDHVVAVRVDDVRPVVRVAGEVV